MIAGARAESQAGSRARGALWGLALGDALGMPTQSMSPTEIAADYGEITALVAAGPRQRIAAGMPTGSVTDDTEQAVLLARLLLAGDGRIDQQTFAHQLLSWQRDMQARGSLDLLGPSTNSALQRLRQGVPPAEAGRHGTTNGAAMRITPVGLATPLGPADSPIAERVDGLVDAVVEASLLTHHTSLGLGAAAAVAGAVSAGIDGASTAQAVHIGIAAAAEAERRAPWVAGGSVSARLRWALPYLSSLPAECRMDVLAEVIGTSVAAQESVVAALALAATADPAAELDGMGQTDKTGGPWRILCRLAGAGGDTDTMAAIAGAVLGATRGVEVWPVAQVAVLNGANELDLDPLADALLVLRQRTRSASR